VVVVIVIAWVIVEVVGTGNGYVVRVYVEICWIVVVGSRIVIVLLYYFVEIEILVMRLDQ
jgi:hypothetical protein